MARPRIVASAPILLVRDVVGSANYFRDKVGFTYDRLYGEPPAFCILARDGCHLMLSQVEDPGLIAPHHKVVPDLWNVYFWVNEAEAMYQEIVGRGALIAYELCDQPHGCREFGIRDPDDHFIAFGQDLDAG